MINTEIKNEVNSSINSIKHAAISIREEIAKPILTDSILNEAKSEKESIEVDKTNRPTLNNNSLVKNGIGIVGIGLLSIGAVSRKIGCMIGGVVILGAALIYPLMKSRKKTLLNNNADTSEDNQIDISILCDKIFQSASFRVKDLSLKWNQTVEENHKRLNTAILNSSISEIEKSELLAKIAEEVTFNTSMTDFLVKISNLGKEENLDGIRVLLKEFSENLEKKFDSCLSKQLEVYNSIS
ncbi:MAG: hypothetical protein K2I31_00150 [Duncaniella sp.]|nr:hypothetical protein [Duncaniella sp.]